MRVHSWLFVITVVLVGGIHAALTEANPWPWWVGFPSGGGIYALLYSLLDRFAWKWRPVRLLFQIQVPVLHGRWEGAVTPTPGGDGKPHESKLDIDQHWSAMSITLRTPRSYSKSTMAAVSGEGTAHQIIQYAYVNRPHEDAAPTMHSHEGTAYLALEQRDGRDVLAGGYYTGRDRVSTGRMELYRVA